MYPCTINLSENRFNGQNLSITAFFVAANGRHTNYSHTSQINKLTLCPDH